MSNLELLHELSPYFSLIHSVPGRIRIRISSSIKQFKSDVKLEEIDEIVKKIEGIKSVKLNKLVGSVTIIYDNDVFPERLWKDFLAGENLEVISKKIEDIKRSYYGS